jgi:NAD(P)-dependent dehydrogenase (short-subunit alcohol dehydrogenase family)
MNNSLVRMDSDGVYIQMRESRNPPEVVVITGASAGVGRAVTRRFAAEGAHIALIARGREGLEGARADVEKLGGRALILQGDVADAEFMDNAAAQAEQHLGPIDIWINNATTSVFSPIRQMTGDEFSRVTEVTYLGYVYGSQAALRRMQPRNRGTIVQVGSALSYRAIPLQAAYCAAKHAIQGFTESLRVELMHDGSAVHVTMVHLPAINTPQFEWNKTRLPGHPQPVPPIFQPEVAAEAIHFAAHRQRREVMVGFPTLKAVYGNRIASWYADRQLARMGYESQQMSEPVRADRQHNLWEPVPGDHGAHGRFDNVATDFSPQLWLSMNRTILALGGLLLAGACAVAVGNRESRRPVSLRAPVRGT